MGFQVDLKGTITISEPGQLIDYPGEFGLNGKLPVLLVDLIANTQGEAEGSHTIHY